jgi:hypothetical protein
MDKFVKISVPKGQVEQNVMKCILNIRKIFSSAKVAQVSDVVHGPLVQLGGRENPDTL